VVELLARTGMRVGELSDLDADAVVRIGQAHWLRIPLGKLRNDRYVPLHPELVTLLAEWTALNSEHIRRHRRLIADHRGITQRHLIRRIVKRVGRRADVQVHPHQLRHTLATQAINRGMRLEAIAALLGHRSMEMTLIYARIANRVVADEYQAVSAKIDALYGQEAAAIPKDYETTGMARLRKEAHARMLGNGLCTRRVELDCRMETAAKPAATSRPTSSSNPPSPANETTPEPTANQIEPHSSTSSSTASRRTSLDTDHPYNADSALVDRDSAESGALTFCRAHSSSAEYGSACGRSSGSTTGTRNVESAPGPQASGRSRRWQCLWTRAHRGAVLVLAAG
jgi:hypothetical protein